MGFPIQPFTFLFYGLALATLGALIQLVPWSRHRGSHSYSLAALTLLASLNVMSFLGGFSIGPLVILAASPLAVLLALSVRTHRRPVGLLALTTVLLAAGMWTGVFDVVRQVLTLGLGMAVLVAILQLGRTWRARLTGSFGGWGLSLCACLSGLSLLLGSSPGGPWSGLPFPAAGIGLGLALLSRRYRLALLGVAVANLLLGLGFLSV